MKTIFLKLSVVKKSFRLAALFSLTLAIGSAIAGPLVTDIPPAGVNNYASFNGSTWTFGYSFTVGSNDISVTQLGLLDYQNDGFTDSHDVGIWSDSATFLASLTFTSGSSGTSGTTVIETASGDSFRYLSLTTPLTLTANTTYRIGATYLPGGDPFYANAAPYVTVDSSIASLGGRDTHFGPGLVFPEYVDGGAAVIGPNFIVTVPEPSTVALLGISAFMTMQMFRRRVGAV